MSATAAHEAQIRDLKSRVSQLEMMLYKTKRNLDQTTAALHQHPLPPAQPAPQAALVRTPTDDTNAEEVKRLRALLEQEQNTKADLMANLKEVTDAHAIDKAALSRELAEVSAGRTNLSQELDEAQEALEEFCGVFNLATVKLSDEGLRAAACHIEAMHETRTLSILSDIMPSIDPDQSLESSIKTVEAHVRTLEERAETSTAALESIKDANRHAKRALYETVPAAWSELFTLLNREPFQPPDPVFDSERYAQFINSIKGTVVHAVRKYITSHKQSRQKLCYRSFVAGDLALFLPTNLDHSQAWAAFNVGAPHYFLDMTGVDIRGKDFVIGRIQEIESRSGEPGSENPAVEAAGNPQVWYKVKIQEKRKH